jgi:hypothetical protein
MANANHTARTSKINTIRLQSIDLCLQSICIEQGRNIFSQILLKDLDQSRGNIHG